MQRKVFIHFNEPMATDNRYTLVCTYGEANRTVDHLTDNTVITALFGHFASPFETEYEVETTWIPSDGDDVFSADARARDKELGKDKVIA